MSVLPRRKVLPPKDLGLGEAGWLNFFGPAFVERWQRLAGPEIAATPLANGGVIVRTGKTPWQVTQGDKEALQAVLGRSAFVHRWGLGTSGQ